MSEHAGFQFTDDAVPKAYEEVLVPRLFEPWALLLLDECNLRPNAVVLDVATGPGTVGSGQTDRSGRPCCRDRHLTPDARRGQLEAVFAGLSGNYLYRVTRGTFES